MEKENITITYGSENITLKKGEQYMILTGKELAFIVESAIRNGQVNIKVTNN